MNTLHARTLRASFTVATLAALVGCTASGTFQADIRNRTSQPVHASLESNAGHRSDKIRIGPADRGSLEIGGPGRTATLLVDIPGNAGIPRRLEIGRGGAIVEVTEQEEASSTKIDVRIVENY